ncbi:MAG: carbon storage regulator [Planctomycetota bacterium]|jgi:carbon storage regulator
MLVLSRRKDEKIMIGGRILIKIVEVRGNSVRLGIEAPREVAIYREELLMRHKVGAA